MSFFAQNLYHVRISAEFLEMKFVDKLISEHPVYEIAIDTNILSTVDTRH